MFKQYRHLQSIVIVYDLMDSLPVACPWVGAFWKCQCRPNKRSLHTGSMTHQQSRLLCPTNKDRHSPEVGHPRHSSLHQLAIWCNYEFTSIMFLNHFGVLSLSSHHLHRKTCRDISSYVWVLTLRVACAALHKIVYLLQIIPLWVVQIKRHDWVCHSYVTTYLGLGLDVIDSNLFQPNFWLHDPSWD